MPTDLTINPKSSKNVNNPSTGKQGQTSKIVNAPTYNLRSFRKHEKTATDDASTVTSIRCSTRLKMKRACTSKKTISENAVQKVVLDDSSTASNQRNVSTEFIRADKPVMRYQLSAKNSIALYQQDFDCFNPEKFINDNVVNVYFNELKFKIESIASTSFFIFDTTITNLLVDLVNHGYDLGEKMLVAKFERSLHRWFQREDFFSKDYLLFPICFHNHWMLAVFINPQSLLTRRKQFNGFIIFNSFEQTDLPEDVTRMFLKFLLLDLVYKKNKSINIETIVWETVKPKMVEQTNDYDCAFYMFEFAEMFLRQPLDVIEQVLQDKAYEIFDTNIIEQKRFEMKNFFYALVQTGRAQLIEK